jgi:UDP-2,4-diacetamido-2,4,6-trideoxy-beta-L-altropyranose hydrolase
MNMSNKRNESMMYGGEPMKIVIRTDASIQIGSGHVMRCLTLADELKKRQASVFFVCRDLPGNLTSLIEQKGYPVFRIPITSDITFHKDSDVEQTIGFIKKLGKVEWLFADHYSIDWDWEIRIQPFVGRIFVIDDLANRRHACDLLLDQNLYHNMHARYQTLVPEGCHQLIGPTYALLREEFLMQRRRRKTIRDDMKRILVCFGGSDPTNETQKALEALYDVHAYTHIHMAVDVVVGASNPHCQQIDQMCRDMPGVRFYRQVNHMAELMGAADLMIGAGGITTWERCCLGVPSLIISVAENQEEIARQIDAAGLGIYLGRSSEVSEKDIAKQILHFFEYPEAFIQMGVKGSQLVDGNGVKRVVSWLQLKGGNPCEDSVPGSVSS